MRDILSDLEDTSFHSDEDPVKRAQRLTKPVLPKRFYKVVGVQERDDDWVVVLDGKPIRTPGQKVVSLASQVAAESIRAEFDGQGEYLDLSSMPAYRLVNTALDGVATDPQAVAEDIMRYSGSDLVCYRADAPERLVELQAEAWDPVLDWAREALGARFILSEGVMFVAQPKESIALVGARLRADFNPLRLAALHVMTSISGSALIALAREDGALSLDEAWNAAHVDEDWNVAQWGEDTEAKARRASRYRDFAAADLLLQASEETHHG